MTNDTDKELNETLRFVFSAAGRVKPIKWSWDEPDNAEDWPIDRKLKYACDLASSMNQAADGLQKDRSELNKEIELLRAKLNLAEDLRAKDNATMVECITKNNAEQQEHMRLIQELQARIKAQDKVIEELNGDHG